MKETDNVTPRRTARDRKFSRKMLATQREMLLAQLLLLICDRVASTDEDQDFVSLYNSVKPIAEGVLR